MDYPYNDADRRALDLGRGRHGNAWSRIFQELRARRLAEDLSGREDELPGDQPSLVEWVNRELAGVEGFRAIRSPEELAALRLEWLEELHRRLEAR
jgi:hypothetical protein